MRQKNVTADWKFNAERHICELLTKRSQHCNRHPKRMSGKQIFVSVKFTCGISLVA